MTEVSRRELLQLAVLGGAGLLLAVPVRGTARTPGESAVLQRLIRIADDGTVTLYAKNPEMGQGVKTSLPMILAEELAVDWNAIKVEQADWDDNLENQFSGGSLSIRLNFAAMRLAGACARQMLLQAAANRWGVPLEALRAANGVVRHTASARHANYGQLAREAAALPVPDAPPLKPEREFAIVGRPTQDVDLRSIVTGAQQFGQDIRLPGMLYATVRRCPCSDGQALSFDSDKAARVSGVIGFELLRNDRHGGRIVLPNSPNFVSGVAVVAEHTWAALRAATLLQVKWELPEQRDDSVRLMRQFDVASRRGELVVREDGDVKQAAADAAVSVDVSYCLPFLAHVPMEPMNCTVDASGGRVVVWAATQNPGMLAETLATVLGIAQADVAVHVVRAGGAFGRRYYADYAIDTALLSRKFGRPVKLVWSREDDIRHDYFRSASVHRVRAASDGDGRVVSWHHTVASHSRSRFLERDGSPAEIDNYEFPAGFVPNLRFEYSEVPARIPLGQWRAVEHSSNVFVVASVIDEIAHATGTDPLAFLERLIGDEPKVQVLEEFALDTARLRQVMARVAKASGWGSKLPPGHGRGIAVSYNQGAWIAEVAEVEVRDDRVRVMRITAAVDCGRVINPTGAVAQVEGAILEGLSAALMGEITVEDGMVRQSNFHDYRLCTMRQAPRIDIHFIDSSAEPRGLGEPPLPPVAPAVCNAIFAACGRRIRQLPVRNHFSV